MFAVEGMVEKPPKGTAPSNFPSPAATSSAGNLQILEKRRSAVGGEIQSPTP